VNLKLSHNLSHLEEMEYRTAEWLKKIEGNNTSILNRLDALEEAVTKIIAARDTTLSLEDLQLRHQDLSTQSRQAFWIRAGGLFTAAVVLTSLMSLLLSHYWGQ
jgi:hypothetical protein